MKKIDFMVRQGDVLVRSVSKIPTSVQALEPENGRVILAHGEATGHAHALSPDRVKMFRDDAMGRAFITVEGGSPSELRHDEHSALAIPPGDHEVIRQREYSPEAVRNVAD